MSEISLDKPKKAAAFERGAVAARRAESDNAGVLPAARRTCNGIVSWYRMDSDTLWGGGDGGRRCAGASCGFIVRISQRFDC